MSHTLEWPKIQLLEFEMRMHLVATSTTELSTILSAVCQTIGLGTLMYLPCPNRADVLEFPGFSPRRPVFPLSSLCCFTFVLSTFALWFAWDTVVCFVSCILQPSLYKLETQIPTFEHCSCLNDFVFRQNAKVRRYQVSTSTFLKSQYGDAIEYVFVLFQNVAWAWLPYC